METRRLVVGAPVRALAFDGFTDTVLAFNEAGGIHVQNRGEAFSPRDSELPGGLTRVESAGAVILTCHGDAAPAHWSLDGGLTFDAADFGCGFEGRRTAVLVDGLFYALIGGDSIAIGTPGQPAELHRALPGEATALAALPPRIIAFGSGLAWRSDDDGATFLAVDWPSGAPDVRDALFLAKARVVAVGHAPRGHAGLVSSADAGSSFQTPSDLPRHTEKLAAVASSGTHVLVVPEGPGEALLSTDDAAHFGTLPSALSPRDAVVSARGGFVAVDAALGAVGLSGVRVPSIPRVALRAAVFPHPLFGLGVDAGGDLRVTRDGGLTWSAGQVAGLGGLVGVARAGDGYGLILGGPSGLFRLDDPASAARRVDDSCSVTALWALPPWSALASCVDGTMRWFEGGVQSPSRVPAPGVGLRSVVPGDGGRPVGLSSDGRRLLQFGRDGAWLGRSLGLQADDSAVDLATMGGVLVLLTSSGRRHTLSRFDSVLGPAADGLSGGGARRLVPIAGGGALVATEDAVWRFEGSGSARRLHFASGLAGLVSTGDGTVLGLADEALFLFVPR